MSRVLRTAVVGVVLALVGCADDPPRFQDAGPGDAAVDAEPIDAAVDAPTPLPAYELTGAAKGVRGARFAADVQIGHGLGQAPVTGAGATPRAAEGNAAVKP
ncbi:MAG TPA: hypothetical protein VM734_07820 [Kofleriaceae bacterium]|nr:hypothetical protein [Kofleriaceae bacterium]